MEKKIKVVVIEDEKNALDALIFKINSSFQDIQIMATASSVIEGIAAINETSPDLIFLDIELPDGDGFQILDHFKPLPFSVIFTTAYNQFALKAIKISAIDYLLKPIDSQELITAINKYKGQYYFEHKEQQIQAFRENIKATDPTLKKIVFPNASGYDIISINEINYCKADRNYTWIFTLDQKQYIITQSLGHIEEMLSESHFFRIHQSYLINLNHLKKFVKGKNAKVIIYNNISLNVSQANRQALLQIIGKLNY